MGELDIDALEELVESSEGISMEEIDAMMREVFDENRETVQNRPLQEKDKRGSF